MSLTSSMLHHIVSPSIEKLKTFLNSCRYHLATISTKTKPVSTLSLNIKRFPKNNKVLTRAIEQMPKLKHLDLAIHVAEDCKLRIRSASLESIYVNNTNPLVDIVESWCPMLQFCACPLFKETTSTSNVFSFQLDDEDLRAGLKI